MNLTCLRPFPVRGRVSYTELCFSTFWRLEVQDKGAGSPGPGQSVATSWFIDAAFSVSSPGGSSAGSIL